MPGPRAYLKWIEVDIGALRANARKIAARLGQKTRFMAVVKADAYGHGAVPVARAAQKEGVYSLGVLTSAEAAVLRRNGIRTRIHLLAPILPSLAAEAARLDCSVTVDDLSQLNALNAAASASRPVLVHLDLDFGLGRWGISPRRIGEFLSAAARLKKIRLEGISAHIDYIPGKNAVEAEKKLRDFQNIAANLRLRFPLLIAHAANSSVLADFPDRKMDLARIGNLIYGINPAGAKAFSLGRPWHFKARVIAIRQVPAGRLIGYAGEYVAPKAMRVATLPVGYADGLTMEPAERLIRLGAGFEYWGRLGEVKVPFIGRCGISHVLVDVTNVPRAKIGDVVVLPVRRTAANAQIPRVYI